MAKRKRAKAKVKNVYGLCKYLAKKNGWSKAKTEKCILKFKRNRKRKV